MKYKVIGKYRGKNATAIYHTKEQAKKVMNKIKSNNKIIRSNHFFKKVPQIKNARIIKIR